MQGWGLTPLTGPVTQIQTTFGVKASNDSGLTYRQDDYPSFMQAVVIYKRTDIGNHWFQCSPITTKHLTTASSIRSPMLAIHACSHIKVKISLCTVNSSYNFYTVGMVINLTPRLSGKIYFTDDFTTKMFNKPLARMPIFHRLKCHQRSQYSSSVCEEEQMQRNQPNQNIRLSTPS